MIGPPPRYEILELPPDSRGRKQWAVVDWATNRWVEAGGEVDIYYAADLAQGVVRRLRYLDNVGISHG